MLMLFAAVRRWRRCSSGSVNAAFTSAWQSSNAPSTSNARTLPPQHVSWCCWRGDTCPFGNSTPTRISAPAVERRRDRPAGVARRRDENRERPRVGTRERQRTLHQRREETRADVLERRRRPVKELEHRELAVRVDQRAQRQREVERVAANRTELALEARAGEERREQLAPRSRRACRRLKSPGANRGSSSGTNRPPSVARPRITASIRPTSSPPRVLR